MEKLETTKEEIELTIQNLHKTTDKIEEINKDNSDWLVKLKTNAFIQELEKEIEWNEQILEEINDSIEFSNSH